jgi:hypothetical protein
MFDNYFGTKKEEDKINMWAGNCGLKLTIIFQFRISNIVIVTHVSTAC